MDFCAILKLTFKQVSYMEMFCNFLFPSTHTHSLIVLDEIDQLDCKSQEILYTLFEWPALTNSRLILIGESKGQTYSHAPLPSKYINL